jgi:hypothetical protein
VTGALNGIGRTGIAAGAVTAVVAVILAGGAGAHAQIRTDEEVLFLPTAARLSESGTTWLVPIHGWIYEPERSSFTRRAVIREIADELDVDADAETSRILSERAHWLMVDNERGKRIEIAIGDRRFEMPPSAEDGHFEQEVELPVEFVARVADGGRVPFRAVLPAGDEREFAGAATLVEPVGLTVISDIDDTVKVSDVMERSRLLRRTFLEPFEAVEGIAERYRSWNRRGAVIWFVSASPWQLYTPLSVFLSDAGFPTALWQMKRIRLTDRSLRRLFADPYEYKLAEIEAIIDAFPQRRVALIGDSGEKDPETYGELARRHPEQVVAIAIRDVTAEPADAERYRAAFRDVPRERWQIFREPAEVELPTGE